MSFLYVQSEPGLYTVGHYNPAGGWISESDFRLKHEAAARCSYLNGGQSPPQPEDEAWRLRWQEIQDDARQHGMCDIDVFCAWNAGLSVWQRFQSLGGKFPHQGGAA